MTKHKSLGAGVFAVVAVCLAFMQTAQCMDVVTIEGREPSLLPQGKKFKLVWNDEFDGDRLDASKWSYRTNFWGQRAYWFATPEDNAVEVKDGLLHLKLVKKPDGQFVSPQLQTGELLWDVPHMDNPKSFWPLPKREKAKFTSDNTEKAAVVKFSGKLNNGGSAALYGLYPYDKDATISSGVITTSLPDSQEAKAGSFDDKLFIAVGKTSKRAEASKGREYGRLQPQKLRKAGRKAVSCLRHALGAGRLYVLHRRQAAWAEGGAGRGRGGFAGRGVCPPYDRGQVVPQQPHDGEGRP